MQLIVVEFINWFNNKSLFQDVGNVISKYPPTGIAFVGVNYTLNTPKVET
jgi:hypothetical protein